MVYYKQLYSSPIGEMSLVADNKGLVGIWFVKQKYAEKGVEEPVFLSSHAILTQTKEALDAYFAGRNPHFERIPLSMKATAFQERVWRYLTTIPYGQVVTYGEIGKVLGVRSAQAVGGAVGRNPYSILIPCHRVIGKNGQLTGYAAGLDKKDWLLAHELSMKKEDKTC
ncbi:methylated-DNA--[protein]-cysteine S-methyltransferase [Streptococcus himalayensis]|uniref:Methylated-DNA--protein-cysteine methyltransferase n=1 Tax=Streptococcus himalayensis TaxID=1888195 RepID=A0A917A416_9STRE|nr:methylated-DNA--[protein]-cysteine S-methyltransferase [Streptococcus himalayensis]GGE25247.1 methylated-DNA--protein-cysteine methyltransferase [Streptococcus himalayensis]